jgi:integrase
LWIENEQLIEVKIVFLKMTFHLLFSPFSLTISGEGFKKCDDNVVKKYFNSALRRTGLPRIRFHNLRHIYASLFIAQGEHPKYIQSEMVHGNINVTIDIYDHLTETVNQKAALLLGRTVLGEKTFG